MQVVQGNYLQNKIVGVPGNNVGPTEERFIEGNLWTNPTNGELTIPSPPTESNLLAAGFEQVEGGNTTQPVAPEDITYAALKTKVGNSQLEPGKWYRITDYANTNKTYFGLSYTGSVEPLMVQAFTDSVLLNEAYAENFPQDIVRYDINDNAITDEGDAEWEDSTSTGGDFTVSNFTTTSIDIDKHLIIDDNFYLYAEDDDNDHEWTSADVGNTLDISYPSANVTRITQTTQYVNFNHPDYNYGELSSSYKIAEKTGTVYYREDPVLRIKTLFDFRGTAHAQKRIDVTNIPDYASGTTYAKNTLVKVNDNIYKSMVETDQSYTTNDWVLFAVDVPISYLYVHNRIAGTQVELDDNYKMVPTFSLWDGSEYQISYNKTSDIVLESPNITFGKTKDYQKHTQVYVPAGATGVAFSGKVQNVKLGRYSSYIYVNGNALMEDVTIDYNISAITVTNSFARCIVNELTNSVIQQVSFSNFGYVRSSNFKRFQYGKIGFSCWDLHFGSVNNTTLGDNCSDMFLAYSSFNVIGNSAYNIQARVNGFSNNNIGDLWKGFKIMYFFNYNRIGNYVGSAAVIETKQSWQNNIIGNSCFTGTANNSFGRYVLNNYIGNKVNQLKIEGSMNSNVIQNSVTRIFCHDLYNSIIGSGSYRLTFAANIQNCTFEPGTRNITSTANAPFQYNAVADGYMTLDGSCLIPYNTARTKMYRSNGQPRLEYRDDKDRFIMLNPATCTEIIPDVKYSAFNEPLYTFSVENGLSVTGASNNKCPGVLGFSQPNGVACSGLKTYDEAVQWCADQGGRLPTIVELEQNSTQGTGCGYDNELCWSQSPSPTTDHYWVCKGNAGADLQEKEKTDTAYVRVVYDKFRRN